LPVDRLDIIQPSVSFIVPPKDPLFLGAAFLGAGFSVPRSSVPRSSVPPPSRNHHCLLVRAAGTCNSVLPPGRLLRLTSELVPVIEVVNVWIHFVTHAA